MTDEALLALQAQIRTAVAVKSPLVIRGGGHPMAAGLTVEAGKLEALRAFLAERFTASPRLEARTRSMSGGA